AVAHRKLRPGAAQEQLVERRRPGRDIDAAHVARPAIAAAAPAFDGEGMRDTGAAPRFGQAGNRRAIVDPDFVDRDAATGFRDRPPPPPGTRAGAPAPRPH